MVISIKGAQRGHLLSRAPAQISVYEVLSSVNGSLFEGVEDPIAAKAPDIEAAMRFSVFEHLDSSVKSALSRVTLEDLVSETEKHNTDSSKMFYI